MFITEMLKEKRDRHTATAKGLEAEVRSSTESKWDPTIKLCSMKEAEVASAGVLPGFWCPRHHTKIRYQLK